MLHCHACSLVLTRPDGGSPLDGILEAPAGAAVFCPFFGARLPSSPWLEPFSARRFFLLPERRRRLFQQAIFPLPAGRRRSRLEEQAGASVKIRARLREQKGITAGYTLGGAGQDKKGIRFEEPEGRKACPCPPPVCRRSPVWRKYVPPNCGRKPL